VIAEKLGQVLLLRGWRVVSAREVGGMAVVGLEFMGGRAPTWLKAFEVPIRDATPAAVEAQIFQWQGKVLRDLAEGRPSPLVRRMIAEHGQDAVIGAMTLGAGCVFP
jgi:hypothetical protein